MMDVKHKDLEVFGQNKNLIIATGALMVLVLLARKFLYPEHDPREPPIISHPIPFIGHVIGMFRHGARYFDFINLKHHYPIYTLPTLTGRTYIVTSPHLAGLIQRSSKSTSFYSAILEVTRRICAFDARSMDVIFHNANGDLGTGGLMPETHDMMNFFLGPSPILNDLTKSQLEIFGETLSKYDGSGEEGVDLLQLLREQFTMANAKAFYGPENPYAKHPGLVEDFWTFEQGMMGLLADICPSVTARKAHMARKRLLAGLVEYVREERYQKAANIIQQRITINMKHGLTTEMAGHAELIMLFAIVGNAVPTAFWMLANIFSRPELLKEVRKEIEVGAISYEENLGSTTILVDKLKTNAPVLTSCFRETLRLVANLTSVRWVLEDMMLGDTYLLKKDSIVQVASGVIHADEKTWGSDVDEFNPRRFVTSGPEETTATAPLPKGVPSAAFRAFGGGSVICPGRHFALSEIVGFVAAVLMAFEIEKPGGGTIEVPKRNNGVIPLAVMKPLDECKVVIKKRPGSEKVKWELDF